MASTSFTGGVTKILASWLNPVNNWTYGPATKTIAKTLTPEDGVKIFPQGTDGGVFIGGTGKAVGYYDDTDADPLYGERFKPTGGDGTSGWQRFHDRTAVLQMTVSDAITLTWPEGQRVILSDRDNYHFKFQSSRELFVDIPGSEITFDDELHILVDSGGMLIFDDWDLIPQIESENYARYEGKVRGRTDSVEIDCYGDSITFAQANASDPGAVNRIGDPTNFGDGSVYANWQFTSNYPTHLASMLNEALAGGATVNNRGFSGDRMSTGYLRHRVVSTADISLVMYGINDVVLATTNGVIPEEIARSTNTFNVIKFTKLLHIFCAREVLRGKCVIVMGCTPFESATGYDGTLSASKLSTAYSDASQSVAASLNLKYIDTRSDIFKQYSSIFNDGTHLNAAGLKLLGNRMSAPLMGGGYKNNYSLSSGDVLLAHELHSRMQSLDEMTILQNATSSTPPLLLTNPSTVQMQTTIAGTGENNIIIPFYAETDNLVIYPTLVSGGAGTTIELLLDDGAANSFNIASFPLGLAAARPLSSKTVTVVGKKDRSNSNFSDDTHPQIHVPNRGWHFLKFRNTGTEVNTFLDSLVIDDVVSVLANDVVGGVTARVSFDAALNTTNRKNISPVITKNATGDFTVAFNYPLDNDKYSIVFDTISANAIRLATPYNVTVNGFSFITLHAPGIGAGVVWVNFDSIMTTVRVFGGR